MWLDIKDEESQNQNCLQAILTEIETTNGAVKMASATFHQCRLLILTLMSNNNRSFSPFSLII
jgi:hypothetical protein